uniref:RAC-gamma serine/threonine-protein kinase-like isoform X2 n=1 Tax=Ciona intestinalis TaxID=7719 RepID=UPI0002B8E594|nr:RAC-gamma serine/threonine-protein kinase-like isoform X2 [Ciona intestinalis]|eukprot:XP_009858418.2 RAC-gamma serine/threonine-protein kinase-like isoform X2 [Ciona intestinalis]
MATTVKEGWLLKRGEYIKNWRPRYFYLKSDGSLLGYKEILKPDNHLEPLNNFSILRCQIMKLPKLGEKFVFVVRCFQFTTLVERTFACTSEDDQKEWIKLMKEMSDQLEQSSRASVTNYVSNTSGQKTLADFDILKVMEKGLFGKVLLVKEKNTTIYHAIKMLKKKVTVTKNDLIHTLPEFRATLQSKHPFITALESTFQTDDFLCFVLEYVNGGEIFFHLSRERVFSEDRARFYGAEIILALDHLHKQSVVFRRLNLEVLLLDSEGHIKIANYGTCKEEVVVGTKIQVFSGKPEYLAPEILTANDYGPSVDWWGLGVVMYEMMCGRLPFYNRDHDVLFELILTSDLGFSPGLSEDGKNLLSELLNKDPLKRLGCSVRDAEEVMAHKFFSSIVWKDMLEKKVTPSFIPEVQTEEKAAAAIDPFE